jgi:hypothetical protein
MIELGTIKIHLRLDLGDTAEDSYLTLLLGSALDAFQLFTNRTLIDAAAGLPEPVGNALKITPSIRQGALLLIGQWYLNRESLVIGASVAEMPMATQSLWAPYRWSNI